MRCLLLGKDNGVHISEVDFIIEGDHEPCAELPNPEPSDIDRMVARRIEGKGFCAGPSAAWSLCCRALDHGLRDEGVTHKRGPL